MWLIGTEGKRSIKQSELTLCVVIMEDKMNKLELFL